MAAVPKEFADDFALWESVLRNQGETDAGIAEIKQAIRDDWQDDEKRLAWIAMVKREAEFERQLRAMGAGITDRIRNRESA